MIPLRLRIKNFLSYGNPAQEIDFSGFKTAIITGPNGSGKSSIIEAMIYALFGRGRLPLKNAEHYIREGSDYMEIDFTFTIDGNTYRIIRGMKRSTRSKFVDAYIIDKGSEKALPIRTKKGKDEYIQELLGVDYDSFINSSFITQNNSATFSKEKKPAERHALLASILRLETFEQMAKLTKEKIKELNIKAEEYNAQLKRYQTELEKHPDILATKIDLEKKLAQIKETKAKLKSELREIEENINELTIKKKELDVIRSSLDDLNAELDKNKLELQTELQKADTLDAIIKAEDLIRAEYEEYRKLTELIRVYQQKASKKHELELAIQTLKGKLESEKARIESEIKHLNAQLESIENEINAAKDFVSKEDEITKEFNEYQLKRELFTQLDRKRKRYTELMEQKRKIELEIVQEKTRKETELQELLKRKSSIESELKKRDEILKQKEEIEKKLLYAENLSNENEKISAEIEEITGEIKSLRNEIDVLKKEKIEIDEKKNLLSESEYGLCPLCGAPVSVERKNHIIEEYNLQIEKINEKIKENITQINFKTEILKTLQQTREQNRKILNQALTLRDQRTKLTETITTLDRLEQERKEIIYKSTELEEILSKKLYCEREHEEVRKLESSIAKLEYDEELYLTIQNELELLRKAEEKFNKLKEIKNKTAELENKRITITQELFQKEEIYKTGTYANEIKEEISIKEKEMMALGYDEIEHRRIEKEYQKYEDTVGKLERLENAKKQIVEQQRRIENLQRRIDENEAKREEFIRKLEQVSHIQKELPICIEKKNNLEKEIIGLENEESSLSQAYGGIVNELERMKKIKLEIEDIKGKSAKVSEESRLYGLFERVVGRDGIQSYIVRSAIPIIESEANRLLEILTDGKIKVKMDFSEELKEKKLEIILSYDGKPRYYSSLSGGEAFRVDFALRIGLSYLLAMRSGKPLKTLVIDEGFGTQDSEGIDALVECINMIEPEFEKIIIISHLNELREKFTTVIDVKKDPVLGSQIFVK